MYNLKLSTTEEEILEFERKRMEVFGYNKKLENLSEGAFTTGIESGDLLAFRCLQDEKMVGGMLLELDGKNINILRLFVEQGNREQGAGKFMLDYLVSHQDYFEDYYATEIKGIVTEPIRCDTDYYSKQGFVHGGTKMYKKYYKK